MHNTDQLLESIKSNSLIKLITLINSGYDINQANEQGVTPLIQAASLGLFSVFSS